MKPLRVHLHPAGKRARHCCKALARGRVEPPIRRALPACRRARRARRVGSAQTSSIPASTQASGTITAKAAVRPMPDLDASGPGNMSMSSSRPETLPRTSRSVPTGRRAEPARRGPSVYVVKRRPDRVTLRPGHGRAERRVNAARSADGLKPRREGGDRRPDPSEGGAVRVESWQAPAGAKGRAGRPRPRPRELDRR